MYHYRRQKAGCERIFGSGLKSRGADEGEDSKGMALLQHMMVDNDVEMRCLLLP